MKTCTYIALMTFLVCCLACSNLIGQNSKLGETSNAYETWLKQKEQERQSWEKQKGEEHNSWEKQKEEEYRQFLENQTNWNKIVLGEAIEPAVIELSETEPDKNENPPAPEYVAEEISLEAELKQLQASIHHLEKELAVKKLNEKYFANGLSPNTDAEIEPPKQEALSPSEIRTSIEAANDSKSIEVNHEKEVKESLYKKELEAIPNMSPIQGAYRISSSFGYRKHPIYGGVIHHDGVDMACPKGTPVLAPADGVVEQTGWVKGYGNFIKIRHGNGYLTAYGHLSGINVRKGDQVEKKDVIGRVGSTGNSTGNHLHYEVIKNGKKINPARHLG